MSKNANISSVHNKTIDIELQMRPFDAHKGSMGHAALIAGSRGMAGAAILSSRACMRSGVGKLTLATASFNLPILQVAVPEVIVRPDSNTEYFSEQFDTSAFQALAIGPGIGTADVTEHAVLRQISQTTCPLVLDADALNILSKQKGWASLLPPLTILTPHRGELRRLLDREGTAEEELHQATEIVKKHNIIIIIKGHNTAICMPDGSVRYNTTGNPGMATAGSGDVLTGILLGLLARGYTPAHAAWLAPYLHGLAGDMAADQIGQECLIASDIIQYMPQAYRSIYLRTQMKK